MTTLSTRPGAPRPLSNGGRRVTRSLFAPAGDEPAAPGPPPAKALTWLDHQHYLIGDDRSDAPRIPGGQLHRLFPDGAPLSWSLVVAQPRRRPRLVRAAAAIISLSLGLATVLSQAVASAAAGVFTWVGEVLAIALHVIVFVVADGHFGLVGRLIGAAALVGALARFGWQLSRRAHRSEGGAR